VSDALASKSSSDSLIRRRRLSLLARGDADPEQGLLGDAVEERAECERASQRRGHAEDRLRLQRSSMAAQTVPAAMPEATLPP
jgi:hypothetical protein